MRSQCIKHTLTLTAIAENAADKLYNFNCLLSKLTRLNLYSDALQLFTQLPSLHHLKPDDYTLSTALTACSNLGNVKVGNQLHAYAIRSGLKSYSHVANSLLSVYAKSEDLVSLKQVFEDIRSPDAYSWTTLLAACVRLGDVDYAFEMFGEMPKSHVAGWNAMITGFAEKGCAEIAVDLFREMHTQGLKHDNYSFASVLSLCSLELIDFGRQVHTLVTKTGFLVRSSVVNALLTMFFSCGYYADAYLMFEETEVRDQITFNTIMDRLGSVGRYEEALLFFKQMLRDCLRPTELTFLSVMSSCLSGRIGHQIHAQAIKLGFEAYTSVNNAAINMYSTCGDIPASYMIFQRLEMKDLISWNSMISCYAQGNCDNSPVLTYKQMQREGFRADEFTYGSLLTSSGSPEVVEMVQALIIKDGRILKTQVSNALVSAYAKHGMLEPAYQIFNSMSLRNLISWNTIISGFLLNGYPLQGLELFSKLLMSKLQPNVYTLSIALSICSSISSFRHGKEIHGYIFRCGVFQEISLCNTLITLYARCGVLDWSFKVFNGMRERDTISWNAMISAYAQHGKGEEAVQCFETLLETRQVEPDVATFTCILSACSHVGLVDTGARIFNSMINEYGLVPGEDHLSCLVDLLGRAGYLDEAEEVINSKLIPANSYMLWALFSACAGYGNLRLGRIIAEILLEREQNNPSVYVLLSNIYAAAGQWEEATNIRELSRSRRVIKEPGCSWIGS